MKVQIQGCLYLESKERHKASVGVEEVYRALHMEPQHYEYVLKEYTGRMSKPLRKGEPPKEIYRVHGYFPTVESAMLKVLTMRVKESTAENLSQLIRDVTEIRKEISKAIQF